MLTLFTALVAVVFWYTLRLVRVNRQVWNDYGIQLGLLQAWQLLRHQVLQIVGGRQLRYDSRLGRVILSS